jgi:hypothetical protein
MTSQSIEPKHEGGIGRPAEEVWSFAQLAAVENVFLAPGHMQLKPDSKVNHTSHSLSISQPRRGRSQPKLAKWACYHQQHHHYHHHHLHYSQLYFPLLIICVSYNVR